LFQLKSMSLVFEIGVLDLKISRNLKKERLVRRKIKAIKIKIYLISTRELKKKRRLLVTKIVLIYRTD
jgi:hypothetical protein